MNRGTIEEVAAILTEALEEDGTDLAEAFQSLKDYIPESTPDVVREDSIASGWEPGSVPFFTEGFLYPLMGKEDARSILAAIRKVQRVLYGEDYYKQPFSI